MNRLLISRSLRAAIVALIMTFAATLVINAISPSTASAQRKKKKTDREKAQDLFKEGQGLFKEGRFKEAGVLFLSAFNLDAHPAVLYNVGRAFEEAGELVKALGYYRTALGLSPSPRIEEELAVKIKEIEHFLRAQGVDVTKLESSRWAPKGVLTVKSDPPGAVVELSQKSYGYTPLEEASVPQGAYTVVVRKMGYQPSVRDLTIVAGKSYLLDVELVSEEEAAAAAPKGFVDVTAPRRGLMVFVDGEPTALTPVSGIEVGVGEHRISVESVEDGQDFPPYETTVTVEQGVSIQVVATYPAEVVVVQEDTSLLSQTQWGYVVGGAGGALLATGLVFGVVAQQNASNYLDQRGAFGRGQFRDDALTQAIVADVFYGLGVAVAATGVALVLFDDGPSSSDDRYESFVGLSPGQLRLAPSGGRGAGASLEAEWSF